MASPADLPPAAREAVDAVAADPDAAVKLLFSGGIGTGKSAVLAAIRGAWRAAGRQVSARPAPGAAVVVDDAHLLGADELDRLTVLAGEPGATVVVSAEPLVHHTALRALVTALDRENTPVSLGPLAPTEVARTAALLLGGPPPPDSMRSVMTATAGLPFLVQPTLAVIGDGPSAVRHAARVALIERLRRLDEPLLDTLLLSSLSFDIGPDDVAAALQMSSRDALAAVDRARASGLLEPSHSPHFVRAVHDGIAQICGAARHHELEVSLLASQLGLSTLSAELAVRLAEHGLRDDRLADALTAFAARTDEHPARAARLYRAAADAGATALRAQLADALALTGDCDTARRLSDELLTSDDAAERAAAVRVAASVAMHDGSAEQAHDLFGWLGPTPDAVVGAAATIAALAAGDAAAARTSAELPTAGPPTSIARTARALATGLVLSLDQSYPVVVARLGQSIGAEARQPEVAPDSPAALVALTALHGGDTARARSVLGRAVRAEGPTADAIFVTHRHRLLLGWTQMQEGQLQAAAAAVPVGADLHRRDALWAAALQTAIARRSGDSGAMQTHWYAATEVLAEYSVDLFSLLPLGELWVAAARMRQLDRIRHLVDQAFTLLAGLGDPALWSLPLHWAGVHAGILANDPDAVAPHGQALTAAGRDPAAPNPFARALATAGRTWLRVLADQVDVGEVTAAAKGLAQYGHTWDATRLAGQAALQTSDPRVSQAMLQLARDLKQTVTGLDSGPAPAAVPPAGGSSTPAAAPARPASAVLSDREREVAELLLLGMPYRDIGAQLFISAKTVEHHVARIRRRIGAESRSEMLSMLRAMLGATSRPTG